MNRNSAFRFVSMIAPLLLLAMAGCAHRESSSAAPPPPMPTTQAAPEASGFTAEEYVEGEATVVAVNRPRGR